MRIRLTNTREKKCLTLWGWLTTAVGVALPGYIWMITIHDFLARHTPLKAPVMVVEGYPDAVLDSVATVWATTPSLLIVRQTASERTYTVALAAREKLKSMGIASGKVDVVCLGTHARRSQLLYRKAFQPGWNVGVISYRDGNYSRQWWRSSEGARAVVYEMFAWLYCVLFFHP